MADRGQQQQRKTRGDDDARRAGAADRLADTEGRGSVLTCRTVTYWRARPHSVKLTTRCARTSMRSETCANPALAAEATAVEQDIRFDQPHLLREAWVEC